MDLLDFPRDLRESLQEVGRNGGRRSLRVDLDHGVLDDLRSHFYGVVSQHNMPSDRSVRELDEFLEAARFERRVTYCLVRLRESGVPREKQAGLLKRAIERAAQNIISGKPYMWVYTASTTLDEVIVSKLVECFLPYYYPNEFLRYEILEEHALISRDPSQKAWRLTNLGEYAERLNTFSLLTFLLAIELSFARESKRGRYPTMTIARNLLAGKQEKSRSLPIALNWYGITDSVPRGENGREYRLTDFGRQLLSATVSNFTELKDLILLLVESEHYGFKVAAKVGNKDALAAIRSDTATAERFLAPEQQRTLKEVARLHAEGKTLNALRLVYPLIEASLNTAISEQGIALPAGVGMRGKIETLVGCGRLPALLGSWAEIVTSRNKVVHGNIDSTSDLLDPLFDFVMRFFREVLRELDAKVAPVGSVGAHNTAAQADT